MISDKTLLTDTFAARKGRLDYQIVNGFTNWKDATRIFSRHKSCDFHKSCADAECGCW